MGELLNFLDGPLVQPATGRDKLVGSALNAGVERLIGHEVSRFHTDPKRFLGECVMTRDEADSTRSIKAWPTGACPRCRDYITDFAVICPVCSTPCEPLHYVEELVETWHALSTPGFPSILVAPKARRFKVSWLFSGLHTWLAIVRRESSIFLQSRTEAGSKELIDRCEFILERIPESKMKLPRWERTKKPPQIEFENGSKITGIAEGAHNLRGYTATALLLDEMAFWLSPKESYEAIRPLVEQGCRATIVSTANPGFFRQLVEGTLRS